MASPVFERDRIGGGGGHGLSVGVNIAQREFAPSGRPGFWNLRRTRFLIPKVPTFGTGSGGAWPEFSMNVAGRRRIIIGLLEKGCAGIGCISVRIGKLGVRRVGEQFWREMKAEPGRGS